MKGFQVLRINQWHGRDARPDHKMAIVVCDECKALVLAEDKEAHDLFHKEAS